MKQTTILAVLALLALPALTGCDMDLADPAGRPAVGPVVINEILASNDAVLADPDHGDFADWVELYNTGDTDQDIGGWSIGDSGAEWTFPAGTVVPAGGWLLVWCDDRDEAGAALHTNFKLGASGDEVVLRDGDGTQRDFHAFGAQQTDVSEGRDPDGGSTWTTFAVPTPGAANGGGGGTPATVLINEFLASNDAVLADPDHGDFADWIELYNAGGSDADIGGWTMTDDLAAPDKWTVPEGTVVPAGGFLLIWADGLDEVGAALHAGFKLSGGGEQVGLFDTTGAAVDTLTFGPQETDVSTGRLPDGGSTWTTFTDPTPGASNGG